jgi:hypothetical protein
MRAALTTTIALPAVQLPATRTMAPAPRRRAGGWSRLFSRRREPTLFQRCLAVHMASAGTLSALR